MYGGKLSHTVEIYNALNVIVLAGGETVCNPTPFHSYLTLSIFLDIFYCVEFYHSHGPSPGHTSPRTGGA